MGAFGRAVDGGNGGGVVGAVIVVGFIGASIGRVPEVGVFFEKSTE